MTDRFNALTVVLEKDIREDDAQALIAAISQLRGVATVTGNVVDNLTASVERTRARIEIGEALWKVLHPKT